MLIDSLTFSIEQSGCLDDFWGKLDAGDDATLGVANSARPFLIAARFAHRPQTTLVVVAGEEAAVTFARSIASYLGEGRVLRYPEREDLPFGAKKPDLSIVARRMEAAWAIKSGRDAVVVASARSLLRTLPPMGSNAACPLVFSEGCELSDFRFAKDLIPVLADAGFCVGAAAYPEGHIDCDSLRLNVEHLKQKQDAGASFFVSQLFFDNDCFYRFREDAERAGVTLPITAGIMPFMSKQQIQRMVFMCGASLPSPIIKLLARFEGDPQSLRQAGIEYACRQLTDLQEHGVDGLHVYTMNKPEVARAAACALKVALVR